MAAHQKKARRLRAHLVFLDESGLMLAPLVRRTWAPRGQTPLFHQQGRHKRKVSIIAALSVAPRRRHVGLYFSLAADRNVDAWWVVAFLRFLLRHLRGPVVLVWDHLGAHISGLARTFVAQHPRLHVELFPSYAPELNPVEVLWSHLKLNPLANLAPPDTTELARVASREVHVIRRRQDLLCSFIRHSPLSLRL
jgi:transposase